MSDSFKSESPLRLSRRGFLAAAGAGSASLIALPVANAGAVALPVSHVMYDHELPAARAFAVVAEAAGARISPLGADRFRFSLDTLSQLPSGTAVMGLCSYSDFLLVSDAAKDSDAQVSGHIVHSGKATVTHKGEGVLAAISSQLAVAGSHWPLQLAELLTQTPHAFTGQLALAKRSVPLVSWVITKH